VQHSEFNHAEGETTHFFQIWIEPSKTGIPPGYEQKNFSTAEKQGALRLLASPDAAEGSVQIHADAKLYSGLFEAGQSATLELASQRKAYVHLMRGTLNVNGQTLSAGDAALLEDETRIDLTEGEGAEVLVFDLAP
jgi:redox-sensitive bicupin YhaK (pirin superfamily)